MQPRSTLRRDRRDPELRVPVKPGVEAERHVGAGRRIVCAACGHPITTEPQRIEMNGCHEHRCVNPDGVIFHIGCFQRAPGCVTHGVPTTEFTWFPGFAWNFALCSGCSTLLGWAYHAVDAPAFFGLILDRLASEPERSHS
jgi:hypothetical protein